MSPDDELIEVIERLALSAFGCLVVCGLGADLFVRILRRKVNR